MKPRIVLDTNVLVSGLLGVPPDIGEFQGVRIVPPWDLLSFL